MAGDSLPGALSRLCEGRTVNLWKSILGSGSFWCRASGSVLVAPAFRLNEAVCCVARSIPEVYGTVWLSGRSECLLYSYARSEMGLGIY